jgi:hypothetical protein
MTLEIISIGKPERRAASADHGSIAWIAKFGMDIVADEIEKRRELGIRDSLFASYSIVMEAGKQAHESEGAVFMG